MRTLLTDLYHGHIHPSERTLSHNSACKKALKQVIACGTQLQEVLAPEDHELLDTYSCNRAQLSGIISEENFIAGLRLGALLILEIQNDTDDFTDPLS